jgi:hypothetical protein
MVTTSLHVAFPLPAFPPRPAFLAALGWVNPESFAIVRSFAYRVSALPALHDRTIRYACECAKDCESFGWSRFQSPGRY